MANLNRLPPSSNVEDRRAQELTMEQLLQSILHPQMDFSSSLSGEGMENNPAAQALGIRDINPWLPAQQGIKR